MSPTRLTVHSIPPHSSNGRDGDGARSMRMLPFLAAFPVIASAELRIELEGLGHDLVHVVIAVGGESSDEVDAAAGARERLVPLVQGPVFGPRDGVIRVAVGSRIFVDHAGPGVLLAGEVLELGDAGVGVL